MKGSAVLHELKTLPEPFQATWENKKLYELRENDRDFKMGDLLKLNEYKPCERCGGAGRVWDNGDMTDCGCEKPHGEYTHRYIEAIITYKTRDGAYGLEDDWCVLGIVLERRFGGPK